MISESVRMAVLALVETDPGATDAEKEALTRVLAGRIRSERVVKFAEAARRLGVAVITVKRMAKAGRLRAVSGSGKDTIGISEDSINTLLEG